MSDINTCTFTGRLARNPELRKTAADKSVCSFTLAVDKYSKSPDDGADFFNVVAYDKRAETISKYCTKGMKVGVSGALHTRTYEAKDGTKRTVVELFVNDFCFLEKNNKATGTDVANKPKSAAPTQAAQFPAKDEQFKECTEDEDLPF